MMKTTNPSPRCATASSSILRYCSVFLLGAAIVAGQGRPGKPPAQTNSNNAAKRPHVATLHSSDSPEGSRVALSSDQSLNDYEAYRRGDRFYVRIPAADVPRVDALRGRGFADVKAQRTGDSTVVSFRLQPGSSAHVEQRANRLEVVFTVPGASSTAAAKSTRVVPRSSTSAEANRNSNTNKRTAPVSSTNKNSADRSVTAAARNSGNSNAARNSGNSNSASKTGPSTALVTDSPSKAKVTPLPSPTASLSVKSSTPTAGQQLSSTPLGSPTTQPTPVTTVKETHPGLWARIKERVYYWILLAQLNPVPIITGAVVLLLLFGLFLFQRRRAKSPRRARSGVAKSNKSTTKKTDASVLPATSESKSPSVIAPAIAAAAATGVMAVHSKAEAGPVQPEAPPVTVADPLVAEAPRRDRIAQVSDEARKLTNGAPYDESIIGSDDRETRQIVGAELLSAIVGRNPARRETARAAFIKHGYFDDATRDLRVADSANERAAAARRLSFVQEREATPHLVGALDDPSPDVRRAAVEALMDLRDPAAIGPLNSLLQTENDRKVSRTLIKNAIDACATRVPDELPSVAAPNTAAEVIPDSATHSTQSEREVIEL